jgi:hypothetical protein
MFNRSGGTMTATKEFETIEEVSRVIRYKLREDSMYAELFGAFFHVLPNAVDKLFWLMEIEEQDGTKNWCLDYSVPGGGGWLNLSLKYNDLMDILDSILKWEVSKEVKKDILQRKQCMMEYLNRTLATDHSVGSSNPKPNKTPRKKRK